MAGSITGVGTTFGLPNYEGELFALTPANTPLLSSIGGLTGGGQVSSVEFEWQEYDLRLPNQTTQVEGATAPTAQARVRDNIRNVVEIHQEAVSVSYTKQSAVRQYTTPSSAPYRSADGQANDDPVIDEMTFQLQQAIKTIALDVNFSFWNGVYANPTTNGSARQTRGVLNAITTNKVDKSTSTVTGLSSATDTITETATALSNDDKIVFTSIGTMSNVVVGRRYWVVQKATNTFKVAATQGGTAITLGTSTSNVNYSKPWTTTLTTSVIDDVLQMAYDNGGLTDTRTGTIACNSAQKRAITAAYANAYLKADPLAGTRNVGGVDLDTIITDFGTFNIMMDRHIPADTIAILSLEELMPVFMEYPGKGVFFAEPLAKTGAFDAVQLYGEIGLKYGVERHHAMLRGLAV